MKRVLILLTTAALLCGLSLPSQTTTATQTRTGKATDKYAARLRVFEEFVRQQMTKDKIPGMTIGFSKDGYQWVKGFGYADLENKIPAKAESAYRLASVTKTMTGTAIVQLMERGKINLDSEIQTYVPYYPKQKWPVTVKQLLAHLGGGQTGSGFGPEYVTPREVVARIAKYPIKNEPGVKFDYQTSGYNLLGAAIEEISGQSFGDYLRENLWQPLGMKDTRMDSVPAIIPNRVQGYELVNGEIRNAPYLDVSARFGGGGAIGTVPDLLRWAQGVESGRILSKQSLDLMFTPVATKGGRYAGLGDGDWYYTLGWLVFPVNGHFVMYNDGGQTGTNTMVLRIPSENLSIAFACNLMTIDRMPYIKKLYEAITDQPWDIPVHTKDKVDEAFYKGIDNTFNYGSLHFDKSQQPFSTNSQELTKAFAYFNHAVNRAALASNFDETLKAINDGRHPVADVAFIKVGSYIAMKLRERYGVERAKVYHTMGAIPFFADYIEMYKAAPQSPQELRFDAQFEETITRWNLDWQRTWNKDVRRFAMNTEANFNALEPKLRTIFSGAEVFPNLMEQLRQYQQQTSDRKDWSAGYRASKLMADLYPESNVANIYLAVSALTIGRSAEAEAALRRAVQVNPRGISSPGAMDAIALSLFRQNLPDVAINWLRLALEIYPKEIPLYASLGEYLLRKGMSNEAFEVYRRARAVDAKFVGAGEKSSGTTTFRLKGHRDARRVSVAGSFNNWNNSQIFLSREGDGWIVHTDLAPGKYLYKFVVDGNNWITDPNNPDTEDDGKGNINSVLTVKAK